MVRGLLPLVRQSLISCPMSELSSAIKAIKAKVDELAAVADEAP